MPSPHPSPSMRIAGPALVLAAAVAACQPHTSADAAAHAATIASADRPVAAAASAERLVPARRATGPSFDCAQIVGEDERLICADPELGALDRRLDATYREALDAAGEHRDVLKATQIGWLKGRGDCWKADDKTRCVREAYLTRLVELQIGDGRGVPPTPVEYDCNHDRPVTATFYNGIEPRAAVITWGNDQAIAFAQPAVGGVRYTRTGLEFRAHRGEVTVSFDGVTLACRPAEPAGPS